MVQMLLWRQRKSLSFLTHAVQTVAYVVILFCKNACLTLACRFNQAMFAGILRGAVSFDRGSYGAWGAWGAWGVWGA